MKINTIFCVFLTAVFVLGTMAMNAQTKIYIHKTGGITNEYNINEIDSISFSPLSVSGVPVTGVTLNESMITLVMNETRTLLETILPENATNQNVTWSTNNSAVASVDFETGEIKAKGEGTAVITVTTEDGGFTAECEVTVIPLPDVFTNLLLNSGFENPDNDTPATIAPWVAMTQDDLLKDAVAAPNRVNANRTDAQFWTNNPAIHPPHGGKYTGRLQASSSAGLYQLVTVEPGKTYRFKASVLNYRNTPANQTVKIEQVRIKSADGNIEYASANIGTDENVWMEVGGSVTIPEGVTQIRFQISHYDGGTAPNRAPITLVDDCEFYEITNNDSGVVIDDFPINPPL